MGSVIDYEDCPYCNSPQGLCIDFYYKTGEEYRFCHYCGYMLNWYCNRDLLPKKENGDIDYTNFMDDKYWVEEKNENPMGVISIKGKDNVAHAIYSIQDEKQRENLLTVIRDESERIEIATERVFKQGVIYETNLLTGDIKNLTEEINKEIKEVAQ